MRSNYSERIFPLDFKLGSVVLFSIKLDLWVSNQHFHYRPVGEDLDELLHIDLGEKDGVVFWFYPISHQKPHFFTRNGLFCYLANKTKHYIIDMHQSFDDYFNSLAKKTRSTIRREVKRFDQFCGSSENTRVYRSPAEMQEFYRLGRLVSRHSWQEKQIRVGLPKSREFRGEMMRLAENEKSWGFILFQNKKPVAFEYLVVDGSDVIVDQFSGYDWRFRALSPGTVLFHKIQRHIFAENKFRKWDLMGGEGEHKRKYANECIDCAHIFCFRKKPIYLIIIFVHLFLEKISALLRLFLYYLGIKDWMKKSLRVILPSTVPRRLRGIHDLHD